MATPADTLLASDGDGGEDVTGEVGKDSFTVQLFIDSQRRSEEQNAI